MESKKLTLIQINDAHGYIRPHKEVFFEVEGFQEREAGGNARIKKLVDEAYEPYREQVGKVVGKTDTLLCRDRAPESTMNDFLLHAISHEI